jgi:hypothetical protein
MSYTVVPAGNQFDRENRTHWRPKLRPGFFYIKDRLYYLFAKKQTIYVIELKELRWELAAAPVGGTGSLQIEGVPWENYWVEGRTLVVPLQGIDGVANYWAHLHWDETRWNSFKTAIEALPDNAVNFSYDFLTWSTGSHEYTSGNATETLYMREADVEHHMPNILVPGTPVVITDDTKKLGDARDYQLQFKVTEPRRSVLFNMYVNAVENPHFARGVIGSPSGAAKWYFTDPITMHRISGSGYVGTGVVDIHGTGKLVQDVLVEGDHPVVVQAWARAINGPVTGWLELAFKTPGSGFPIVDGTGGFLAYEPNFTVYSVRVSGSLDEAWSRISIVLGEGTEFDPSEASFPDVCDRMEVRVHGAGTQWGAVAVHQDALRPGQYNYVDDRATVEFETDPSGFWRFDPSGPVQLRGSQGLPGHHRGWRAHGRGPRTG